MTLAQKLWKPERCVLAIGRSFEAFHDVAVGQQVMAFSDLRSVMSGALGLLCLEAALYIACDVLA
jgi:hypothetical protein